MCIATRDNLSVVFVIHLLVVAVCSNISVRTYVGMLMVVFVATSSAFDHLRNTCFHHVRSSTLRALDTSDPGPEATSAGLLMVAVG